MVEFDLYEDQLVNWKSVLVLQKDKANKLFDDGVLLSYSFSLDPFRFWVVINASSESELLNIVQKLPLSQYLDFDYFPLNYHSAGDPIPAISLN